MPLVPIPTLDDPRLAPFRGLKDRDLRARDGRFIAEGKLVVRRLLGSDAFATDAVLCIDKLADEMASLARPQTPIYVTTAAEINRLVGFRFHNGCLAVGRARPLRSVGQLLDQTGDGPATFVVAHELNNTENLGAILRIAAGFGAAGLILGPRTADPFYRQAIRVSMGAAFSLLLAQSNDLIADLALLRSRGVTTLATVATPDAEPLHQVRPAGRQAIVLGGEAHGLDDATIRACDRKVTIPMHLGTDSLNVSIAAAIFLYALTPPGRETVRER